MRIIIFIISLFAFCVSCTNNSTSPVELNNQIVSKHLKLEQAIDSLSVAIAKKEIVSIEKSTYSIKYQLASSIQWLQNMDTISTDSIFFDTYLTYCKSYEVELPKLVTFVKKSYMLPNKKYSVKEHSELESIIYNFNQIRRNNIYNLEIAQESFARRHNFVISGAESSNSSSLDAASRN